MIPRIYIDTSVLGGCFEEEFQEASNKLITLFRKGEMIPVVSNITIAELESAPEHVNKILESLPEDAVEYVSENEDSVSLAKEYVNTGAVSQNSTNDASHIAIATVSRVDMVVSWNFKDMVNWRKIRSFNSVNLRLGYPTIDIRSPKEIVYE